MMRMIGRSTYAGKVLTMKDNWIDLTTLANSFLIVQQGQGIKHVNMCYLQTYCLDASRGEDHIVVKRMVHSHLYSVYSRSHRRGVGKFWLCLVA